MDKKHAEQLKKRIAGKKVQKVKAMYYIPADLHEALKDLCAEEGSTASDTVEELVREYLEALGKAPR